MSALIDALRQKFRSPREAMAALGLDADLLAPKLGLDSALGGNTEDDMGPQLSPKAALAEGMLIGHFRTRMKTGMAMDALPIAFGPILAGITAKNFAAQRPVLDAALRVALKGCLANDADIEEVTELLRQIEGVEAGADTATEANAGMPAFMREDPEDADDETPEESEFDADCDARARDARMRMGRDETEEEAMHREEEEEFKPDASKMGATDTRMKARDARKMRRAADARKRLGRDEMPEEMSAREREEEAMDRRHARDRSRMGRDYRRARDAHRDARDAHRRHAADWRRARDAHKGAMDARKADDAAKAAMDMRKAEDAARTAHDAMVRARDARHRARDARRAHDARMGRDDPSWFPGRPNTGGEMEPITKEAMDAAIQDAVTANDRRHREIAEALAHVRPKAGSIAMDGAIRTAGDVYARALDVYGVDHAGVTDQIALRRLYEVASRPGSSQGSGNSGGGFANDAALASDATGKGFDGRYPGVRSRYAQH